MTQYSTIAELQNFIVLENYIKSSMVNEPPAGYQTEDEPCGARSPTFSREVGWPGDRGPRAPTEPYVIVSCHTALVVLASPHGTGFGDPGPVHEVARRLLDARVPLPHGSGPAGPQSAILPQIGRAHV